MKTIQIILGAGVVAALVVGLNVAFADVISQRAPIEFDRDVGEGIEMPAISFDFMGGVGEEEVHGGCMMTPGGQESSAVLPLPPPVIVPTAVHNYGAVEATLAPLNSFNTPPRIPYERPPRRPPDDPRPVVPDTVVPAPATLVIVGIGLAGIAAMRRWQVKPVPVE